MEDLRYIQSLVASHSAPGAAGSSSDGESSDDSSSSSDDESSTASGSGGGADARAAPEQAAALVDAPPVAPPDDERSAVEDCLAAMVTRVARAAEGLSLGSDSSSSEEEDDDRPARRRPAAAAAAAAEEEDGGPSDDAPPRTKNELAPSELPVPTIAEIEALAELSLEEALQPLGRISSIVDDTVVVQSDAGAPIMNDDSVLALEGRRVLGPVAELFGRTDAPMYTVRFGSGAEVEAHAEHLKVGARVYVVSARANPLNETVHLYQGKGSDASNKDDEEPAEHERDYSDDEEEQAAKAAAKQRKRAAAGAPSPGKRGGRGAAGSPRGRGGRGGSGRGGGAALGVNMGGHMAAEHARNPMVRTTKQACTRLSSLGCVPHSLSLCCRAEDRLESAG